MFNVYISNRKYHLNLEFKKNLILDKAIQNKRDGISENLECGDRLQFPTSGVAFSFVPRATTTRGAHK